MDYGCFDETEYNNLNMNIMFLQYLNLSQSGSFDYIFDNSIDLENYTPKVKIIKRTSPTSRTTVKVKQNSPKIPTK